MPSSKSPSKTPTRPRGACGRADLALALADGNAALALAVAEFTGYEWRAPEDEPEKKPEKKPDEDGGERPEPPSPEIVARPLAETPFWQPTRYEPLDEGEPTPRPPTTPYGGWSLRPKKPPTIPPLADWRELEPRLRRPLCLPQQGRTVDLELTVRLLGQALFLAELPRERRRRWGPTLHVIEDRSARLIPYRLDQYLVREALRRLLPVHALGRSVIRDGMSAPRPPEGGVGSIVLVLGDLGCLAGARTELCERWLRFGRDLRAANCIPVALIPGPLERCPARLAEVWQLIPWERPRDPGDTLELRTARLLRLVSPAVRIEPGLLRAARLLLAPDQADAGTEADVWQHPDLIGRSAAGATLNPERAKPLRAEFASQLAPELQARFAGLLRAWRGYLPEEIWFEELLNLPPAARTAAEVAQDLPCARDYFADFARDCGDGGVAITGSDLEWFGRVEHRAERLWGDEQVGDDLKRLSYALHEQDPDYRPPPGFRPDLIRRLDRPVRRFAVGQQGEMLEFAAPETPPSGSHLADCTSRNGLIQIKLLPTDPDRNAFWRFGQPPPWADDWGTDDYGHWVTFSVENRQGYKVTQRMRWIEPGTFLMGSPEDEPERSGAEGPQHSVTISRGFWLWDTACTQALWEAVMGDNPSRFKGAGRPVENVSWNDCQDFLKWLNERRPGLDLGLPTEAQWEYACRAGTTTPFSFGDSITSDQVNYDGSYPYLGGNKGQYRQGTVQVASLPPNPWGLYEMHGNVYEWMQDHAHNNYQGAPTDGSAWEDRADDAFRVLRGGSWNNGARDVRAAYRYPNRPAHRGVYFGFRCARVRSGADPAAKPDRGQAGEATSVQPTLLRLDASPSPVRCALPKAPAFFIHTDCERLTFRRLIKPTWASAIGRDRFGLWCEIAVDPGRGEPVVQRLRWIPPGRFWMGSPEEEPGRFDKEGPRHLVTLIDGYWLFDTPCTQSLWEAVIENNPSRFQSPTRPVEQVSWDDTQTFLSKINERIHGLNLVLPSEAQWEYACRAGTETALYTGELAILGECNAPALDPIAWYSGNSGVEFDLTDGEDSSDWPEKQYSHTKAGTHPVKLKRANPWGLYDMLGNVWEWCQDGMKNYDAEAQTNPTSSLAADADRVLRGGSWGGFARRVRTAFRNHDHPVFRFDHFGFRCARVQGEQSQPAAE
ncbi:MAG TPA: formylglycine-generating enzyme family protein [Candidatus Competibacter sp.]|nr:formylglycine-generating enzyme family protein [Candidatus Competibacter sp.]